MNPDSRYASAESKFVVCHDYDELGQVVLNEGSDAPATKGRSCVYRYTVQPLPDPPARSIRSKVTDHFHLYAKDLFNDPQRWWVVADANPDIRHPLDLSPNDKVYLP